MTTASRLAVTCESRARIPTPEAEFQLSLYTTNQDDKEHLALTLGDVGGADRPVLLRVHSECYTGDVLGSLRCDCGPQLHRALALVAAAGSGIILYLRQEGRGIGLAEKLKAYNLQDEGYDTVDANLLLGHAADARDYDVAAKILADLGVDQVRLMTNNPAKVEALLAAGIAVPERVPLVTPVQPENAAYLATKVARMRHLLKLRPEADAGAEKRTRPHVTLSYAQSIDGSIAARRGEPLAISGTASMIHTHELRADHDAILVGIGTLLADDPRLTVRRAAGENPQPVIVDSALRTPLQARLLSHPTHRPWILTTARAAMARQAALEGAGAEVIRVPAGADGRVDLAAALTALAQRGVTRLMVEGGASIITSFLNAQLVDELVLTVAPLLLGGLSAVGDISRLNGHGRPRLLNPSYRQLGEDIVLRGTVSWE